MGSLPHEFGHFLQFTLGFPEETEALYNLEAGGISFLRPHAIRNFREYFANVFAF